MRFNNCLQSRTTLAGVILLAWLFATGYAFWWFEFRDLKPFAPQGHERNVLFVGENLTSLLPALLNRASQAGLNGVEIEGKVVLVHFWRPDCSCSQFNEQHVQELVQTYRPKGLEVLVVARREDFSSEAKLYWQANQTFGRVGVAFSDDERINAAIASAPAAMVFAADGELAYFGPYSQGAVCSAGSGRFVERILDEVLTGQNPGYINTLAYGCFCRW